MKGSLWVLSPCELNEFQLTILDQKNTEPDLNLPALTLHSVAD